VKTGTREEREMVCVLLSRGPRSSVRTSEDGEERDDVEGAVETRMPKPVAQLTSGVRGERSVAERVRCTPGLGARALRRRRKGEPLEAQGGRGSGGVHEQIHGVERTAEEGNAEVLTGLYEGADAEDDAGAGEGLAEQRDGSKTDAEEEDEGEGENEVDQVAGDEGRKRAGVARSGDEMECSYRDADGDDDGLARQVE
jgi:hypothetical protein